MLIILWLIFNHSYIEKWAFYVILYVMQYINTDVYPQPSAKHCSDSTVTSLWRLEVH